MNDVQSTPGQLPAKIEYEASPNGDIYIGQPEDLIAAGIVTAGQIPGWPGMPSTSASFVNGVLQPRGQKPKHDERWMQVSRYGGSIRCTKGVSAEEQTRRAIAQKAANDEAARNTPKADIGLEGAQKAYAEAGTAHKVGDRVFCGKESLIVTSGYKFQRVGDDEGEFVNSNGHRGDYLWGYVCQYRNGEEWFFRPGYLNDEDGSQTHLRLVYSAKG